MDNIPQEIKDKLTKVCICRGITTATMKQYIRNGENTVEKLVRASGATTGGCKGHRCGEKIVELVDGYNNGEWQ